MSLTRRGRLIAAWITAAVLVIGGVAAVLLVGGRAGVGPLADIIGENEPRPSRVIPPPPPVCPLTGVDPEGEVPSRPALAIKVENSPAARPQTGLSWADIVYEEPVEGGITRYIAVYQCQDAGRVEPVRSVRLSDPDILVQFGRPLFAYSGGAPGVAPAIKESGVIDVNYLHPAAIDAYARDPARSPPHDLYTSTKALYRAVKGKTRTLGAPDPVFLYTTESIRGKKVNQIHLPFSTTSDVYWKWDGGSDSFLRYHGAEPHVASDGTHFSAKNVVVQVVELVLTNIVDPNGVRSPKVISVGEGKAYVLRNGRLTMGRWERPTLDDLTKFYDRRGNEIRLVPGNTWVELVPQGIPVTYS